MHVVLREERRTPRRAEARRPLRSVPLATEASHLVELPVQHGQLVRLDAVVARATEAQPQRKVKDIPVRLGAYESDRRRAIARQRLERLERGVQIRTHEGPAQTPCVL